MPHPTLLRAPARTFARRQLALNLSKHAVIAATKGARLPSREARRQVALAQGLDFEDEEDAAPRERQGVVVGRRKGAEVEANPWLLRTKALMLLTPSPEYMHHDMRITPEMVAKTFARTLTLTLALTLALTLTRSP